MMMIVKACTSHVLTPNVLLLQAGAIVPST